MDIKELEEAIKKFPLSLLAIKDKSTLDIIDSYLPFSVGIEIECDDKKNFNEQVFKRIPNILDVNCDLTEKRFRIPTGLKGLICLFHITKHLKEQCLLNPLSGIHYHIDMTDVYEAINNQVVENVKDYILIELDTWNYIGTFNERDVRIESRCWVRFKDYTKTCEFRIGEMSFDYELIFKRILHCTEIVKFIKKSLNNTIENIKICKLEQELKNLKNEELLDNPLNNIGNRIIDLRNYGK